MSCKYRQVQSRDLRKKIAVVYKREDLRWKTWMMPKIFGKTLDRFCFTLKYV